MKNYILGRLIRVPPMLLGITVLSFLVVTLVPKYTINPMVTVFPQTPGITEAEIAHRLGTDQPIWLHYLRWMGVVWQEDGRFRGVLEGDLGRSWLPYWSSGK